MEVSMFVQQHQYSVCGVVQDCVIWPENISLPPNHVHMRQYYVPIIGPSIIFCPFVNDIS